MAPCRATCRNAAPATSEATAEAAPGGAALRPALQAFEHGVVRSRPLVLDLGRQKDGEQNCKRDARGPSKCPFAGTHHLLFGRRHVPVSAQLRQHPACGGRGREGVRLWLTKLQRVMCTKARYAIVLFQRKRECTSAHTCSTSFHHSIITAMFRNQMKRVMV